MAEKNPLENDPHREHRIRERAYHLWEQDGRPAGRDLDYWERARELVGMEESRGAGELPNPMTHPPITGLPEGVEEAEIQENLGEFPGRFTDQGDEEQTPEAIHAEARGPNFPRRGLPRRRLQKQLPSQRAKAQLSPAAKAYQADCVSLIRATPLFQSAIHAL